MRGDTFRAAAADQLEIWAGRTGADIVRQHEGADPAAVVYDGIQAANARHADVILCDTAGRLHNKANLMNEPEQKSSRDHRPGSCRRRTRRFSWFWTPPQGRTACSRPSNSRKLPV